MRELLGGWRSYSAPPVGRKKVDNGEEDEDTVDVELDDKASGRARGRRKSLG